MILVIAFLVIWYTACFVTLIPSVINWYKNLPCKVETIGKVTAIREIKGWSHSFGDNVSRKHKTTYHLLAVEFKDKYGNIRTVLSNNNYGVHHKVGEECKVRYCECDSTHACLIESNIGIIVGITLSFVPVVIVVFFFAAYHILYVR